MNQETTEGLRALQLLIATARSDGKVDGAEREAIDRAFASLPLPEGYSVDKLLSEEIQVDAILNDIQTPEIRRAAYEAAYLLAHADGAYTDPEKQLLQKARGIWGLPAETDAELDREVDLVATSAIEPSLATGVSSPAEREQAVRKLTNRYCVLTALTGGIPVPLIGDLMVVPMQAKMVYDIGKLYNCQVNPTMVKSLLAALGIGTGARIAVSSLSKLIPGWGSLVGASTAYATTFALSKATSQFFGEGAKEPSENLRTTYQQALPEGTKAYEASRSTLEQRKDLQSELTELGSRLKNGTLAATEYDRQVSVLLGRAQQGMQASS